MPEGALLEVRDLRMEFDVRRSLPARLRRTDREVVHALDGVDLSVGRGEALGLVGESGCGKSTLARCVVGLQPPTAGRITFRGIDVTAEREASVRRRIQIVFQDPYSSLNPRMTVRHLLAELLRVHRMVEPDALDERCRQLLELVRLPTRLIDAYPRHLSGGQRQRVSIARALALEPEILVADEPVSALDVSVQAAILNLVAELRRELGLTLVLITHDMAVVRHTCERIAVMYLGRIVETAPTEELFSDARHPYTQALLRAVPRLVPGRRSETVAVTGDLPSAVHVPPGCRFHPRCPIAQQPVCGDVDPALEPGERPHHRAACHFAWTSAVEVAREAR
jgi:oligopeptide transport system ATP-binding protein